MAKTFHAAAAAIAMAALSLSAQAADVGVAISVGQPGFYGQINIGNVPRPVVVNPQPLIVQPAPVYVEPVYLRVPPGHQKHWSKHCHEYNACGRPVHFVTERWYNEVYAPQYRERQGRMDDRNRGYERRPDYDRGYDRDERGNGHGNDRGNGHGLLTPPA